MKLYTEEQVRETFYNGIKYASSIHPASIGYHNQYVEGVIKQMTPIELPSDEEIRMQTQFATNDFYLGAKWMKKQILNQNK